MPVGNDSSGRADSGNSSQQGDSALPPEQSAPSPDDINKMRYDPGLFLQHAGSFDLSRVPCAKEAFVQGALGGAAVGVVRLIRTKYIGTAFRWGIGSFMVGTALALEICRRGREERMTQLRAAKEQIQAYQEAHKGEMPYNNDRSDVNVR